MLSGACAETEMDESSTIAQHDQALEQGDVVVPFEGCVDVATSNSATDRAFYSWNPALMTATNGSVIRCERMLYETRYAGYDVYRVVYRTTARVMEGGQVSDVPVPATGTVFIPTTPLPQTTRPVIAHTHGLTGAITKCAPSFGNKLDSLETLWQLASVISEPVVVAPDYVGLGIDHGGRVPDVNTSVSDFFAFWQRITPFSNITHPFVSLSGEGRATVDLVRAARTLPRAGTGSQPDWLVVGQSQGGHAALATAEVVTGGYGNNMHLRGVIAGAPASEFENRDWDPALKSGLEAMVTVSATLENRDLRASSFLNDKAMSAFYYTTDNQCVDTNGLLNLWALYGTVGNPWRNDPFADSAALAVIRANSPGNVRTDIPTFVGQVRGDPLIKVERTHNFITRTLNTGNDVTYCEYTTIDNVITMNNHNAFTRMRDTNATCMDKNGVAQTWQTAGGGSVPLTMLAWLQTIWPQ